MEGGELDFDWSTLLMTSPGRMSFRPPANLLLAISVSDCQRKEEEVVWFGMERRKDYLKGARFMNGQL